MDPNQQHDDETANTGPKRPDDPAVVAHAAGKATPERSSANLQQRQPSQRHNRGPPADDDDEPVEPLTGDVLLGARNIAEHLTLILGVPVDENDVYYAHRMKKLPIGKYGSLLIASRRRLVRHADELTRGPVAD